MKILGFTILRTYKDDGSQSLSSPIYATPEEIDEYINAAGAEHERVSLQRVALIAGPFTSKGVPFRFTRASHYQQGIREAVLKQDIMLAKELMEEGDEFQKYCLGED